MRKMWMDLLLCVVCVCALFSLSLHSIKPDKRHKRRFGCGTPQYKTRSSFPHRDFERHLTCGSSTPSECAQHHRHTHQLQHQRSSSRQKWWWCFLCALRERGLDAFEREREREREIRHLKSAIIIPNNNKHFNTEKRVRWETLPT